MQETSTPTQQYPLIQIGSLILAAVGIVMSIIGAASDLDHFFHIYLVGYMLWLQIALGCLGIVLLLNIVDGRWGYAIKRLAEAGARTLPLLALLFLPVLFGLDRIYGWAVDGAELSGGKADYLTPAFFIVRTVIYFLIWIALAYFVSGWSYQHDRTGDNSLIQRSRQLSIIGAVLYFFTTTLAGFDWLMSLDKDWFSSVYGWLFVSQSALAAMTVIIITLALLWDHKPLRAVLNERAFGDIAALQLVTLMVWIYLSFIQFVVIWSGNLPDKGLWYAQRSSGGWSGYITFVAIFHAIAFILLVIPGLKRIPTVLISIASLLLVMRFADLIWVILPTFLPEFSLQWWDIGLPIGIGGLWVAFYLWNINQQAVIPVRDPGLQRALNYYPHEEAHESV